MVDLSLSALFRKYASFLTTTDAIKKEQYL